MGEDPGVPLAADPPGLLLVVRAGAGRGGDELLGRPAVDRQAVPLQLEAEHRGGGLGVCGGDGPRAELAEGLLLAGSELGQGRGNGAEPRLRDGPRRVEDVRSQVAVGADGGVRVGRYPGAGRAGVDEVEEVVAGGLGGAGRVQPVRGGPDAAEIGPPAAVQEPVDLGDVPAALDAYAGAHERPERVRRGGDQPARMLPLLEVRGVPDHVRQVADDDRPARLARSDGGAPADDHQGEHDPHPTRHR